MEPSTGCFSSLPIPLENICRFPNPVLTRVREAKLDRALIPSALIKGRDAIAGYRWSKSLAKKHPGSPESASPPEPRLGTAWQIGWNTTWQESRWGIDVRHP